MYMLCNRTATSLLFIIMGIVHKVLIYKQKAFQLSRMLAAQFYVSTNASEIKQLNYCGRSYIVLIASYYGRT